MNIRLHTAAALLALAAALPLAAAETTCQDRVRLPVSDRTNLTISVHELLIPPLAWQYFEAACAASAVNDSQRFEGEASKALAIAPAFPEIYVLRARMQLRLHHYKEAIETIAAARRIQPVVPWSSIILATALNQLSRFDEANAELSRAHGLEAETWQWRFEHARAAIGARDPEAALHWTALVLASNSPHNAEAHLLRADALRVAGRPAEVIPQLEAYLSADGPLPLRVPVERLLAETRAVLHEEDARQPATR